MAHTVTREIIEAAIIGFERQKTNIDAQIAELRSLLSDTPREASTAAQPNGRRKFSAAAIERMREAQKKRWAKTRGESKAATPAPKRKLSAATRAKLAANLRKARAAKAAKVAAAKRGAPA